MMSRKAKLLMLTVGWVAALASVSAWAQAPGFATKDDGAEGRTLPDEQQRRAELRSLLESQRQARNGPPVGETGSRHLSSEERAELRQQLRQQSSMPVRPAGRH